MKRIALTLFSVIIAMVAMAQRQVTGTAVENDTQEPLPAATVKLMKTDSTLVKGVLTSSNGTFKIKAPANGKYILRITCVGFKNYTKNITVSVIFVGPRKGLTFSKRKSRIHRMSSRAS